MEQKNNHLSIICILFLFALNACRDRDDSFYGYFDRPTSSDTTYVGQFKTIWTFLDCKYPIWDYEETYGLNWDEVYKKHLPKFEELDRRYNTVKNNELKSLYSEILKPFHDGHLSLTICAPYDTTHIGEFPFQNFCTVQPQVDRNSETRVDYNYNWTTTAENLNYYKSQIKEIHVKNYVYDFYGIFFNDIIYYKLHSIDPDSNGSKLWKELYTDIKKMYDNKSLKGIIIDMRHFRGGNSKLFHYFIGALQPINTTFGCHRVGWLRYKFGSGRHDYSPKTPMLYPVDKEYQLNITDVPIIVLSNCNTASLGEIICLAAQSMNNGYVIGMRTYGALGSLSKEEKVKKNPYLIETPYFQLQVTNTAFFNDNGEILDGKGVTPDIEVLLDTLEHKTTGRDTQLERALEFIRTGK